MSDFHHHIFYGLVLFFLLGSCQSTRESPSGENDARVAGAPSADSDAPRGVPPAPSTILAPAEAAAFAGKIRAQVDKRAADGLTLALWATEQLLEDPIALDLDDSGNLYVTGSSRSGGLLDIRGHPTWTTVALTHETVEDHENFLKEELAPARSDENDWLPDLNDDGSRDWRDLTVRTERLYKIMDASGDGVADRARVLVENFNRPVSDVAGGLLVHDGDVYLSAAPDLWLLPDAAKSGRVDGMSIISTGYGVHPGFFGHGMSGVTVGPDGRIYWSVGDMGYNVTGPDGRQWINPNEGAIFRAFPDGSGFEVFATGLRNTHEFEFDEFGNLISVDNDGDHPGEMERVVYVVEGSDSGWRTNWQFGKYTDPKNNDYKVWMDEELFKPAFDGQAAYILPPIANYHAGPAGMAFNPGTALSPEWNDYFFVSEYTGTPSTTHVYAFRLEEDGAGFRMADDRIAVSRVLTVGMGFGPDGSLYLADWIDGWDSKGAGRIWKLDAENADTALQDETREILQSDFKQHPVVELTSLLAHPDLRIRRKAQFELADRREADALLEVLERSDDRLARIHGLWGLWQLALEDASVADRIVPYLSDEDAEVRAQTAKIVGDVSYAPAAAAVMPLLDDPSARVQFFAAEALGRMDHAPAFDGLVQMLERNAGADVYLRHAGALALSRIAEVDGLQELARHASRYVRRAAVVALRRQGAPAVAAFLDDADEHVVTEAARAINDDGGIVEAIPALAAALSTTPFENEPLLRRAINANLRDGSPAAAQRVADFAARGGAPTAMRAEAVKVLGVWADPSPLDRVDGMYLGPVTRDAASVREVAAPLIEQLLTGAAPPQVKAASAEAAARLRLASLARVLEETLTADPSAAVRAQALKALQAVDPDQSEQAVRTALGDDDPTVRMTAVTLIPSLDLEDALIADLLEDALDGGIAEQQSALAALAELDAPSAHEILEGRLERIEKLPAAVQLDVLEAAASTSSEELRARAAAYRSETSEHIGLAHGGRVERGQWIFWDHESAQCTRCHAVDGEGGEVGPDLTTIGAQLTREQLVEALLEPSARIAPGYGENVSSMPPMGHILTKKELRDVVEYLASLK